MLQAKRTSMWKPGYDLTADGHPIATWEKSMWKEGGTFELDGRRYAVRSNMWGNKYGMTSEDGTPVAAADRLGRKRWTVEAAGRTYEFQRTSIWGQKQELHSAGQRLGSIERTSFWRSDATADLPGLPLPVQIFVFVVVLTMWDRASASAASGTSG
ncbi:MAG: hypothetical protein H0X54_02235 [Propionibacteriales bacterium]|jgi:hypothetical protein|nr:hypothetical protein [Propionibacteriales bacterium]